MAVSDLEVAAAARMAEHMVAAIMRKPSAVERVRAFYEAYSRASSIDQRALYGVVAALLARCDELPSQKAEGRE